MRVAPLVHLCCNTLQLLNPKTTTIHQRANHSRDGVYGERYTFGLPRRRYLIGSGCLKAKRFDEAKEAIEKAIAIYQAIGTESTRCELALAREQMGHIFEGLGEMANVREIRLQGASEGKMTCTCMEVS